MHIQYLEYGTTPIIGGKFRYMCESYFGLIRQHLSNPKDEFSENEVTKNKGRRLVFLFTGVCIFFGRKCSIIPPAFTRTNPPKRQNKLLIQSYKNLLKIHKFNFQNIHLINVSHSKLLIHLVSCHERNLIFFRATK